MTTIETMWEPNPLTGFLPTDVPPRPTVLLEGHSSVLAMLGRTTPHLGSMSESEVAEFLDDLSEPPEDEIESLSSGTFEAVLRAYVMLAAHIIHRPILPDRNALPRSVARPLWTLSERAGRPPSLTYASYVLSNFTTTVRPFTSPDQLEIGQTPSGTSDEEWFAAVHLAVESCGGEVVTAAGKIDEALREREEELLISALEAIEACAAFARRVMPTIFDRLEPETFRERIRPLLYGFDEVRFCGTPGEPVVTYVGETGAQSGVVRAMDATVGVVHSNGMTVSMNRFLACAPPPHRRYLASVTKIGKALVDTPLSQRANAARNAALRALAAFRRTHFEVVSAYLAPEGTPLAERGTGGTHFQVWLQRVVDETEASVRVAARAPV